MILGVPAFWLLSWRKAANAFTCAAAGVAVGTLPYAILFAPGLSGPGVKHVERLIQLALSGAAVGFVFWTYIAWRTGKIARQASRMEANLRPSWFLASPNHELFSRFLRGAGGNEYLGQVMKHARAEFEARRAGDLAITVSADSSGPDRYLISITNTSRHTYRDLRVHYEVLLLDAENFGHDTTRMPSEVARIPGEPLFIDALPPGKTAQVVRKGYGPRDRFDGPRKTALDLEFGVDGKQFTKADRRWSQGNVDLVNSRGV